MMWYNGLSYLSEMGGLLKSLSVFLGFFMTIYNSRNTAALVMSNLYFKERFVKTNKTNKTKNDSKSESDDEQFYDLSL